MNDQKKSLNGYDVEAANLPDWRIMHFTLQARFRTGDFVTGLKLVNEIGEAAEAMNHHPDLDLRYPTVHVRLSSHDIGGISQRDFELARQISEMAARLGATADTDAVQVLELALDTHDHNEIRPFWEAVLGMTVKPPDDDEIVDPSGILPTIWFQGSEANDPGPQRWHLDIRVPPEVAKSRIQAALDAGGTLVTDEHAPAFWVLADPQGNQACVCTWEGRIPAPE